MRAAVVYESMYGNTHRIAEAIGAGLADTMEVTVLPVAEADEQLRSSVDLLVVGGPTHAWSMSRASTRRTAVEKAAQPDSTLELEPHAGGIGVRDWLQRLRCAPTRVAVFDTRMHAPLGMHGSAARPIARHLRGLGLELAAEPMGFFVSKANVLEPGEEERATAWARHLSQAVRLHEHA